MRNLLGALKPKNPHTAIITGVKSALRNGDAETIKHTLSRFGSRIGLPTPLTKELTHIITSRLHNTLTHHDATHHLTTIATQHPTTTLPPDTWLTLENIARTIGCFHASHHFTQHATTHLTTHPHPPEKQFLAHLHTRNLTAATHTYTTHHTKTPFWLDAGHYLWHWSSHTAGAPHHTQDPTWTHLLTGHHITILGPAPTTHTPPPPTTPHHTARVIMQNVLEWDPLTDPFGGHVTLAYANRETRNWLIETGPRVELERFDAVSFREDGSSDKWKQVGVSTARVATNPHRLMLSGSSPNMVPLMMWDVLSVPDVTATIAGTTFFATREAYSVGNRRYKHPLGKDTDETGSTGALFERCPTFARHNVVDNLSLVANLVHGGAVTIDAEGQKIVDLETIEYLAVLDDLYGKDRV